MSLTSTLSCLLRSFLYYENIFKKVSFTLYGTIFVLGIIGNGLVIWIAGFRMKKTISAVWFLNLAIADFLFCMSFPMYIVDELYSFSDLHVNPFCILYLFLFTINMCASILLLMAMSIDRCISILCPFWSKVHRTHRLVRITAVIIWVLSLPFTVLILHINNWCKTQLYGDDYRDLLKIMRPVRLVTMFVIPFLIILTSYVIIFLKLRKSKRPQRSQRSYRIITTIIMCFFICFFPFYVWPVTPMFYEAGHILKHTMYLIANNLAYLNSCMNPIIYVFMSQDFRSSFLRSIPARLERALGEHPDDLSRERETIQLTCTIDQ